jgi:hypothetical protein
MHPGPAPGRAGTVDVDGLSLIQHALNPGSIIYMPTYIKDGQQITHVGGNRDPHPVHDAADTTAQRVHDLMVQFARQGLDISLRSLQVWADMTRQLGPTALGSYTGATYDLFEKLLAAQREAVDELVATQHQFAQGQFAQDFFDTTPTSATAWPPGRPPSGKPHKSG